MDVQLGSIQLRGLQGLQEFLPKRAASYAEHALLDGKPRLQNTGNALDEYQLTVFVHAQYGDPKALFQQLDTARMDGEVLPFIDSTGEYLGDFVITNIDPEVIQVDGLGNWVAANIPFLIREYVTPDRVSAKSADAKRSAFARSENSPLEAPPVFAVLEGPQQIEASLRETVYNSSKIDSELTSAEGNVSQRALMLARAKRTIGDIRAGLNTAQSALNKAESIYSRTVSLRRSVASSLAAADRLRDALAAGSPDLTFQYGREFGASMRAVKRDASVITSINLLRG